MIFKTFIFIFFSLALIACCSSANVSEKKMDIPGKLQVKADEFIISKTGDDFFNKNIRPDFEKTTELKDGYLMVYKLVIPAKEIESEIRFTIDTLGNIKRNREIVGIPECLVNPENCSFNISKEDAIDIAENSNLEKGIKDWDVKFAWNPTYGKYIWEIISTLTETKGDSFHRASGKSMIVDTNSGQIIETKNWQIN